VITLGAQEHRSGSAYATYWALIRIESRYYMAHETKMVDYLRYCDSHLDLNVRTGEGKKVNVFGSRKEAAHSSVDIYLLTDLE